jgi:hypothetical protein
VKPKYSIIRLNTETPLNASKEFGQEINAAKCKYVYCYKSPWLMAQLALCHVIHSTESFCNFLNYVTIGLLVPANCMNAAKKNFLAGLFSVSGLVEGWRVFHNDYQTFKYEWSG